MKEEELRALKQAASDERVQMQRYFSEIEKKDELATIIMIIMNNSPLDLWEKSWEDWEKRHIIDMDQEIKLCIESIKDMKTKGLNTMTENELNDFKERAADHRVKIIYYFPNLEKKYESAAKICDIVCQSNSYSWEKLCSEWKYYHGVEIDKKMISRLQRLREEEDNIKGEFINIKIWTDPLREEMMKKLMRMKEGDLARSQMNISYYNEDIEEYFSTRERAKLKWEISEGIKEARALLRLIYSNKVMYEDIYDRILYKLENASLQKNDLEPMLKSINEDIKRFAAMRSRSAPRLTAGEVREKELESEFKKLDNKIKRALAEAHRKHRRVYKFPDRNLELDYSEYELKKINFIIGRCDKLIQRLQDDIEKIEGTRKDMIKGAPRYMKLIDDITSTIEYCGRKIDELPLEFLKTRTNRIFLEQFSLDMCIEFLLALVNYVLLKIESMLPRVIQDCIQEI